MTFRAKAKKTWPHTKSKKQEQPKQVCRVSVESTDRLDRKHSQWGVAFNVDLVKCSEK